MTTTQTILDWITAKEELAKRATPAPWIIETPIPETLSIVHEPKPNCKVYEWQFVADVPLPEAEEEQQISPGQSRMNSEFIADSRTTVPVLIQALREAADALEQYTKLNDGDRGTKYLAEHALGQITQLIKP